MRKYEDSVSSAINGLPVYLAEISVLNGDGSPAQLYSDQGITPLAQPVLTNGLGFYSFFIPDGTYTLVIAGPGGVNPVSFPNTEMYEDARNVSVPPGEPGITLPSIGVRSGTLLGFDSPSGLPIAVAASASDLSEIAAIANDITAVAANSANVTTVANNLTGANTIGTVAGIAGSVVTVAGIASSVVTVAGMSAAIATVNGNSTNINTVATNITSVNTVAANIGAVNNASTNMAAIIAAPAAASAAAASAATAQAAVGINDNVASGVQLREFDDGAGNPWAKFKPTSFDYVPFNAVKADVANLKLGYGDYVRLQALAEYVHYIFYGQSLAVGNGAGLIGGPALTYALKAQAGVRAWDGGTNFAANWSSLVNLVETAVGPNGETCAYGFATMLRQLVLADTGLDLANLPSRLIISAPGQGATGVVGLSKTININPSVTQQIPYPRLIGDVTYAKAATTALDRTYSVGALLILHGEGDAQAFTGAGIFGFLWERLRTDLQTDARSIVGDSNLIIPAITSQMSTFLFGGSGDVGIALEQVYLALNQPYWALCSPQYHMPYLADNRHMTQVGYRWMGAYFAVCAYKWIFKGTKPPPLLPDRFTILGNTALLHFPIPASRGLAIDTTQVAAQTNYGFSAVDATGAALTINSVRLAGLDTIAIEFATAPAAGGTYIQYAYTGLPAKGNIRDNTGDTLVFDPGGQNKRMDIWMPTSNLLLRSDGNVEFVL